MTTAPDAEHAVLRDRCADEADRRGDPMLGTAFPASRLLLVEQPGPWGRAGLPESRFDRPVARELVARMNRLGVRVVAIRRPGRTTPNGARRWALVRCSPGREALTWGRFRDDAELLRLDPDVLGNGVADRDPVYLVCAHGSHDACCAIRGRPVAAALDLVRPGRVWECSHVGGDRFAANVLTLPTGLLYGRVREHAAAALVDATERDRVLEHHLRGRVGLPPAAQAALALLHREAPDLAATAVRSVTVAAAAGGVATVTIGTAAGAVDVDVRIARSAPEWLTCHAAQPGEVTVHVPVALRWPG